MIAVNHPLASRCERGFRSVATAAGIVLAATFATTFQTRAQDASFGCKVLLCAAAAAPGWSGIPYCVPVMQELFRQLARGRGWPVCQEGRASSLGYDPYLPCPAGLAPTQTSDDQTSVVNENGPLCTDLSKPQQTCGSGHDASCRTTYPSVPRVARPDPNYVDIDTANGAQRFYFSLRGY